jgi:hypothetical protein
MKLTAEKRTLVDALVEATIQIDRLSPRTSPEDAPVVAAFRAAKAAALAEEPAATQAVVDEVLLSRRCQIGLVYDAMEDDPDGELAAKAEIFGEWVTSCTGRYDLDVPEVSGLKLCPSHYADPRQGDGHREALRQSLRVW